MEVLGRYVEQFEEHLVIGCDFKLRVAEMLECGFPARLAAAVIVSPLGVRTCFTAGAPPSTIY